LRHRVPDLSAYATKMRVPLLRAESLRRFLEGEILPWFEKRRRELDHRPLIRAQAFGEAVAPGMLRGLARYEVHLDRKLERILAMLVANPEYALIKRVPSMRRSQIFVNFAKRI
jgi:hypothetical protein